MIVQSWDPAIVDTETAALPSPTKRLAAASGKRDDFRTAVTDLPLRSFRELPLVGRHPTHNFFFGQGQSVGTFNSV